MRDFRKLEIWQLSMDLVNEVYSLTANFPSEEKYGLASQMRRAAVSIPSNVAEGCRGSRKELTHFLQVALGSSFELETQMLISKRLNMVTDFDFTEIEEALDKTQRKISSFRTFILNQ